MNDKAAISVIERRIRRACVLALVALALIVWSLLHPRPLPVIIAMSVGQAVGTLSLLMFIHAIVADVRKRMGGGRGGRAPPPGAPPPSSPEG